MSSGPMLGTIQMVENFIKEHSGEYGMYQTWVNLPKKMAYPLYKEALKYIMESNKVTEVKDEKGKDVLIWVFEKSYSTKKTKRIRPKLDKLRDELLPIIKKMNEWSPYDLMKELTKLKIVTKIEWDNKYNQVCKILNEMELEGYLTSRLEESGNFVKPKRIYKWIGTQKSHLSENPVFNNNSDINKKIQEIKYNKERRKVHISKDKDGNWVGFEVVNPKKRGRKEGWKYKRSCSEDEQTVTLSELKKSYTKSPTPEQIEEIKKRVQAGARYCDVERDMRMNYDVVKRICKEAGIFSRIRKSSTKP